MTQRALIGTAFEYATISNLSARIRNDIQELLSFSDPSYIPLDDLKRLAEVRDLLTNYHFKFSATNLDKIISDSTF